MGGIIIITLFMSFLISYTNSVNKFFVGLENCPHEPIERSYIVREVTFPGVDNGVVLTGELTNPKEKGLFLCHVVITGNNEHKPFDRDYDLGGLVQHKTYLVLSGLMI